MDELPRRRLEHNEQVFRAVNEEIDDRPDGPPLKYVCECADTDCTEEVRLTHREYGQVRSHVRGDLRFPGHERDDFERVFERSEADLIVEKRQVPPPKTQRPST